MNILISHVFGTQNKGDWILISEIINILKLAFPESTIYAVTRDPDSQSAVFPEVKWCSCLETSFRRNKLFRSFEIINGLSKMITELVELSGSAGFCTEKIYQYSCC